MNISPAGMIIIIIGIVMLVLPWKGIEWTIQFGNKMKGIKTEVTRTTIITYRLSGLVFILIGLLLP